MCSILFSFLRWMCLPFVLHQHWAYIIQHTCVSVHLIQYINCFNLLVGWFQSHLLLLFSLFLSVILRIWNSLNNSKFEWKLLFSEKRLNHWNYSRNRWSTIICCRLLNTEIWRLLVMGTLLVPSTEYQVCITCIGVKKKKKIKEFLFILGKCENC